jgi:choice-of-anchor B domain-containing protein
MRILFRILAIVFLMSSIKYSQNQNVDLLGSLNQYSATGYNDIWGYAADGREYALLGVKSGTSIVDVTNPAQPVEAAFIPGPFSTWRDIKTHSHYAYVVTEGTSAGNGLQIIDLSQLPSSAALENTITTWFSRAHNIFIDNGFAYVIGTNNGGGMHILDLSDPVNPSRTAYYTGSGYIHDVYVWDDTVVACAETTYDLVDVTNKSNPFKISGSPLLGGIYAHSGWMTEDKRYFIAAEEFNQRDITVWDLQDRASWDLIVSEWQMPGNSPVHNIFVKGDFAHISYYKDGYVVLDISDPSSPVKVGQYDTYPSASGTYQGAWGCYPFLPSGNVLISDISTGLYIFDFTLDNPSVPVELISFTHKIENKTINFSWETITEINNRGFEIQRSTSENSGGSDWKAIGFIEGAGNSTEKIKYSFSDANPANGISYYRLVQFDFNGTSKAYPSVEINFNINMTFSLAQNYPNPFNPTTKINFTVPFINEQHASIVNLKIYDMLGNEVAVLVNESKEAGSYEIEFNGEGLSSGIYITRLSANGNTQSIKMNLLK